MQKDAKDHVQKCDSFQCLDDMHLAPPHELQSISSLWPYAWWGIYILGQFPLGSYQNKYMIIIVDYIT